MSTVYLVRDGGRTEAVTRVRCKNEGEELQLILQRNPDLLPGDQINPDDPRRWILLKREMPVPDPATGADRWSIDFLFADQDAMPTFVECKRCADTRARREIVGQMLEYAANGHYYWTQDELKNVAAEAAAEAGSTLEASIARLRPTDDLSVEEYFERIQQNLREGQLRIVFFLEDSPPELRSVVDFLNRQMERSEILLVEARQYSRDDWRIVVPTLFGYTEAARQIKRTITVAPAGSRRHWDQPSYFADAAERLSPNHVSALKQLLDRSLDLQCQVTWGTGSQTGSFNVKERTACPRSLITCWSNGDLTFNFGWLNGSEEALWASQRLRELVLSKLEVPPGSEDRPLRVEMWSDKVETVAEVLGQVVIECRERTSR